MKINELVRTKCPNIPFLRKYLARKKIRQYLAYRIAEADAVRAESDFESKRRIVIEQSQKWPAKTKELEAKIDELLSKAPGYQNRTDLDDIRADMLFCFFAYGFAMDEYIFYRLEGKSAQERLAYISNIDRIVATYRMDDFVNVHTLGSKADTHRLLKKYYKRDAVVLLNKNDLPKFLDFVKVHPVFVKKVIGMALGKSVELIDSAPYADDLAGLFNKLIAQGRLILEEKIEQNTVMGSFNPSSVNTVRCVTLNTKDGIEVFPQPFFRCGRAGYFVDNAGSGGIFVAINRETGVFSSDGYDELGNIYEAHPDSGIVFKGFAVPEWETMKNLCLEMAATVPQLKYRSWDMAYTDKGWVIIEGNGAGQMIQQCPTGRGMKKELEAYMQKMDLFV